MDDIKNVLALQKAITSDDIARVYGVSLPGSYQVTKHVFHDTALYTSAATTELFYFNQARGIANIANVITNFYENGQLPTTEAFLITGIGLGVQTNFTVNTVASTTTGTLRNHQLLLWESAMTIKFAHKDYGPIPSICIPQGVGVAGDVSSFTTNAGPVQSQYQGASNGIGQVGNLYRVRYLIEGGQTFYIRLAWSAAQTLSANQWIRVYLHGWWFRQAG